MELWIWLAALALGAVIFLAALALLTLRGVTVAKKLKPFAQQLVAFKKSTEQYPEAVEFYSRLAQSQEFPDRKP
jgi:hypothetical protein